MKHLIFCGLIMGSLFWGCLGKIDETHKSLSPAVSKQEWPLSTPEAQGMDSGRLIEMFEGVARNPDARQMINHGQSIEGITVIRNGYLVLDSYLYPFDKNQKHMIYSNTKSITSALIGIAIDNGYIKSVDETLLSFFDEYRSLITDERKYDITIRHLLTMSSGLDTRDSYLYKWKGLDRIANKTEWTRHIIELPLASPPGTRFEYSNLSSFLLTAVLKKATGVNAMAFAQKHLFGPLGITDVRWKQNPEGIYIGWGDMMLRPHDMAKIGWLYLNKGRWKNRQIISQEWVEASTRSHFEATLFDGYGYQWWVEEDNFFVAVGHRGQFIYVIPPKNMVVVFASHLTGNAFYLPNRLLNEFILPAVVSDSPLVPAPEKEKRLNGLVAYFSDVPGRKLAWGTDGKAETDDGLFTYSGTPGFRFTYPKQSVFRKTSLAGQVMAMRRFDQSLFSAFVRERPNGLSLAEVGPIAFRQDLETLGSDVQMVSNQPFTLQDGTKAYRTDFEWQYRSVRPTKTLCLSAFKDDKWVLLAYSFDNADIPAIPECMEEGGKTIQSLRFD